MEFQAAEAGSTDTLELEIDRMLERARRSVVQVRSGRWGAGAGLIWSSNGLILTNHHVVWDGSLEVILLDGQRFPARLLGRQPELDLALLNIEATGLPVALISDSRNLRVGQMVFTIGHPWGQVGAVTSGIISSMGTMQTRSGRTYEYIRSDAPLAPGNSGGPLINAAGGVIGINHMILGGDQGMAIPVHVASSFIGRMKTES